MVDKNNYSGIDDKLENILDLLRSDLKDANEALKKFNVRQDTFDENISDNKNRIDKVEDKIEKLQKEVARLPTRNRWNNVFDNFEKRLTNKASEQALSSLQDSVNSLRQNQLTRKEVGFWVAGMGGIIVLILKVLFHFFPMVS